MKLRKSLWRRLSLNRRKTLETPENTEFLGGVVADWLQNNVAMQNGKCNTWVILMKGVQVNDYIYERTLSLISH